MRICVGLYELLPLKEGHHLQEWRYFKRVTASKKKTNEKQESNNFFFFFFMRILKLYSDEDKHNTSSAKERLVIHCVSSIQVKKL